MKFKIIVGILLSIVLNQQIQATKRHARITSKKCTFCHRSKKGGDRNLNKLGKEYKIFLKDKKRLRRKKKTKLNLKQIVFWKKILKASKQQRKKKK